MDPGVVCNILFDTDSIWQSSRDFISLWPQTLFYSQVILTWNSRLRPRANFRPSSTLSTPSPFFHRREKLEDSRRFQYFKRDADELETWIHEKLSTAAEETFKDTTNLQAKIQKHQAFEAEVKHRKVL